MFKYRVVPKRPTQKSWLYWAGFLALCSSSARAIDAGPYEITLQADVRGVAIDDPLKSFTDGGMGLLRFDENHDGLRLGRVMANFNGPLTDTVRADLTLSATNDHDAHAIDVTEASLEWRPYPTEELRWRTRIGAFYPPVSLENRAIGWQSPYSISASGINTWIGEEVRTIGVEQSLSIMGAQRGRDYDLSFVAAAYKWNDPMGVLIFQRGWALHDRQTTLFGGLRRPLSTSADDKTIEFFREFDGRIGYYVGAEYKYGQEHVIRVLHYDNRGDPAVESGKEDAWLTRFDSIGWRYELPTNTTFIVQGLKGDTSVGPSTDGRGEIITDYWSYFALASQTFGAHRVSARYDRLFTETVRGADLFNSAQTAIAWTFAYFWDVNPSWQIAVEALQIRGAVQQRALIGLTPYAIERSWQFALRYSL